MVSTHTIENKIIVLIGYPGVGKLSIARKLAEILPHTHVVDNHRCNNVFLPYLDKTQSLKGHNVWTYIKQVRKHLYDFLASEVPAVHNIIVTGYYSKSDNISMTLTAELANRRQAGLHPIVLTCDESERLRRGQTAERGALHKLTDKTLHEKVKAGCPGLFYPEHSNTRELDITTLSADEAAQKIIEIVQA